MNKKNRIIKNKIINHIMVDGQKNTSERILLKSIKNLNKSINKQVKKIFQLGLINSSPIFSVHQSENKKFKKKKRKVRIIPFFLTSQKNRTSLSIKFITNSLKKKTKSNYDEKFSQEVLLNSYNKGISLNNLKEMQKKALQNKKYFSHYRW
jgi:ribosomal protein S7